MVLSIDPRMFQTDLVVILQSFGSDLLTRYLLGVTFVGFIEVQIFLLIALAFGFNLRKGFITLHILLMTSVLTEYLKLVFAMPRPSDLDPAVAYLGRNVEAIEASGFYRDAPNFLSGIPDETLQILRRAGLESHGFPSGHCSGTAALWTSIALLAKRRLFWAVGLTAIVLVAFSRVYLGRHFLGDVVGGVVLGACVVACYYPVLQRRVWPGIENRLMLARRHWGTGTLIYLVGLPFAALALATPLAVEDAGRLFGVNLAILFIGRHGFPDDTAPTGKRMLRVLLAAFLYLMFSRAIEGALYSALVKDAAGVQFAAGAFVSFSVAITATELGARLRLFGPKRRTV